MRLPQNERNYSLKKLTTLPKVLHNVKQTLFFFDIKPVKMVHPLWQSLALSGEVL